MSRGSPGRNVPRNCELSPICRQRVSRSRPSASCPRSQPASAPRTSPPAAVSSSARAHPSAAALAVPAAACGPDRERGVADQADPAERHPGHLDVVDDLHEGLGPLATTSAIGRASWSRGVRRIAATASSVAAPGGSETVRRTPSRPVIRVVERRALADVDVPDDVDQALALGQRAVQGGDGIDEDVAVRQHLVGERVAEQVAGGRGQRPARARCRARPRSPSRPAWTSGSSRARAGRAHPVRAHQQVALDPLAERTRPGPSVDRRTESAACAEPRHLRARAGSGRGRTARAATGRSCSRTRTGSGAAARAGRCRRGSGTGSTPWPSTRPRPDPPRVSR